MKAHLTDPGRLLPKEHVLLYHFGSKTLLQTLTILSSYQVPCTVVEDGDYGKTLGELFGLPDAKASGEVPGAFSAEPLMVLGGFSDVRMDLILRKLREKEIPPFLKCVLTPTNQHWRLDSLILELQAERKAIEESSK